MKRNLTLRDFIFLAILTALYVLIFFIATIPTSILGIFGHAISPGVVALFGGGTIIYFISRKVNKKWQFTVFSIINMGVYTLLGGAYLPWYICILTTAIIADLMCSMRGKPNKFILAIAFGIMQVGVSCGSIIPSVFFAQRYIDDWVKRGQSVKNMLETVKYSSGYYAVLVIVITFTLSFISIYIGEYILRNHLKEDNNGK